MHLPACNRTLAGAANGGGAYPNRDMCSFYVFLPPAPSAPMSPATARALAAVLIITTPRPLYPHVPRYSAGAD